MHDGHNENNVATRTHTVYHPGVWRLARGLYMFCPEYAVVSGDAFAGAGSGSIEVLTPPCCGVPWTIAALIDSEEIVSLTSRPVLPADRRKKAATILIIDFFLSLLKRFYAGFYCWKALDSDRLR